MRIVLTQSRYQNIFNRIYLGAHNYCWVILTMLVLPVFWEKEINWVSIQFTLFFGILAVCLISLWLFLFNRGDIVITEYGLEMTEKGISYIRYDSRSQIKWSDFGGVEVKNNFPRMILIKSKVGKSIEFSYYTFSGEQRRKIFDTLSGMQR